MDKKYNIYKITYNTIPIYIGCTSQGLKKRFYQHQTMKDSLVYQAYSSKFNQLHIYPINILLRNGNVYSTDITDAQKAFQLEELLTYIYGFNFKLVNVNAGNRIYRKTDIQLFGTIHDFLYKVIEYEYLLTNDSFVELMWCVGNICKYHIPHRQLEKMVCDNESKNNILLKLDECCCNQLCETVSGEDYD